ncbi:hypothetical protein [Streptomyces sp. AK02-01A]|uniref:hypothetical protein n=1 Tax=Streptomyces sp. AK02-01A TaxID=3028648 RepID=UPI0029BF29CA|nr:hypothetical protein [Streptomyces sp. AK02-01A]MDX3852789.1 hypothetical protein [Streptomyces sp. AK02-01A]
MAEHDGADERPVHLRVLVPNRAPNGDQAPDGCSEENTKSYERMCRMTVSRDPVTGVAHV